MILKHFNSNLAPGPFQTLSRRRLSPLAWAGFDAAAVVAFVVAAVVAAVVVSSQCCGRCVVRPAC